MLVLLAGCAGGGAAGFNSSQPGINVALAALRGGSPQVALQVTQGILAREPRNDTALVVQGDAQTMLGQLPEATASFTEALKIDPSSVGAHVGMGRVRLASDPAAAEALFLEALQRDPRNTTALNDMGIARDLQGRHADAQELYRRALGINPELNAAQVNLALSLAMSGQSGQAERLLRPLASDPGASRKLRHDMAAVLAMGGNDAEAQRILGVDLSPAEVRQALDAYAAARTHGPPVPLLAGTPSSGATATPVALTPSAAAGSGVQVQFAAVANEDAAQAEWRRLQEQMPALLASRRPIFVKVESGGRSFWRVRAGGFATLQEAESFCQRVRGAGGPCTLGGS